MRVVREIDRLLFGRASAEVNRLIEPDRDERSDVWSPVSPHGADPEELRALERSPRVVPLSGDRFVIAEARVERC